MIKNITLVRLAPITDSASVHPHDTLPPFSLAFVATILSQRGFDIKVIDTLVENLKAEDIAGAVYAHNSDLVIMDATYSAQRFLSDLEKFIFPRKAIGFWCLGHYASALPEILLKKNNFIDGCVIGEPEVTVLELIGCLNGRSDIRWVKGIAFRDGKENKFVCTEKRELIHDLDELPSINYHLLKYEKYKVFSVHIPIFQKVKWGFLLTSRGCPYRCIYCSLTLRQSFGEEFRTNSPEVVVRRIEELINSYGVNAIAFQDDNFAFDKNRVISICEEIIKRKIKIHWVIQARADSIDYETAVFLKKAGCVCIALGVESGSQRILGLLEKGESKDEIRKSVTCIKKAGIFLTAFFMIGCPTETFSELEETLNFARELKALIIQVAFFTPYPGSRFYQSMAGKQLPTHLDHYDGFEHNYSNVSTRDLIKFRNDFYFKYYFSFSYILTYLRCRAPYAFINNGELMLVLKALKYLLSKKK